MKLEFTNSCREVVSVALYHQQHTITTDSLRLLVATAINQAHRLHSNKGCNHQQHMITTDSLRLLVATAINQAHRLHSSTQRMLKEAIYTVKVIFYAKIISFLLCCSHTTTEQSRQTVHITLSTMSAVRLSISHSAQCQLSDCPYHTQHNVSWWPDLMSR